MTLLSAQRYAAYLAAMAGILAILISGEIPIPLTVASSIAFVASYFVGERVAGKGQTLWLIALIGGFLFLGAQVVIFGTYDIILGAGMFAILILIYALFNRGGSKDYARVHLGALLCIAGGSALSADLAFGSTFLVFAVAATWSLTLTQLRLEIEDEAKANEVADGGASILNSKRFASVRFLGVLAGLAIMSLAGAAIIFMAFPRVSFGMLQRTSASGGNRVGFANEVELGGSGRIKDDSSVAFRVTVKSGSVSGNSLGLYWRGATLDVYDGKSWKDATLASRPLADRGENNYFFEKDRGADEFIIELPGDLGAETIFTTGVANTIQMLPRPGGLNPPAPPRLWRDGAGDLTYRPPQSQPFRYELTTSLARERNRRGRGRNYEPTFLEHYTALPKIDQRIIALGKRLVGEKDPVDAVRAVENYLAGLRYTTDMLASGDDPLASFLFDVKAGHCEYFATAMAVLLRAGGIPTRVATGYYGGRYIERGSYYAVRRGDAHAWTEVWFPNEGWVTFDATPVGSREGTDTMFGRFELWMDGVRTAWRNNVVDYDLSTQLRGLQNLARLTNALTSRLGGSSKTLKMSGAGVRELLFRIIVAIAAVVGLVILWLRYRPRAKASFEPRTETQRRARLLYTDLLRRLEPHGITKRGSQTPRELAAELRARSFQQAPLVDRVVERYLASRFGTTPLEDEELKELRRELKAL